jgi:arylsulfatase A-like enzyme
LLDAIDWEAGLSNVTLVLTADHGVAPMAPITGQTVYNPTGGRLSTGLLTQAVQDALTAKFGEGDWVEASTGTMLVLRRSTATKCNADWVQVQQAAAEAARKFPHIASVYTDADFQVASSGYENDIETAMRRSFFHGRSPDLMILPDEYYNFDSAQAVHGTPYEYDTHVPIIFFGAGVKPGRYAENVAPNDIAPTLSDIIGVAVPRNAVGHAIREIRQ